jgi:hypothetical protein
MLHTRFNSNSGTSYRHWNTKWFVKGIVWQYNSKFQFVTIWLNWYGSSYIIYEWPIYLVPYGICQILLFILVLLKLIYEMLTIMCRCNKYSLYCDKVYQCDNGWSIFFFFFFACDKVCRCCIVAFPPSHLLPRKNGYIIAFPPEKWLYSRSSPTEIWLYSRISPIS